VILEFQQVCTCFFGFLHEVLQPSLSLVTDFIVQKISVNQTMDSVGRVKDGSSPKYLHLIIKISPT
jgi:hypothetical protein